MTAAAGTERLRALLVGASAAWMLPGDEPRVAKLARDRVALLPGLSGGVLDAVRVVVSELVTNAHRHSHSGLPGGLIGLGVRLEAEAVTLLVADQGGEETPTVLPEDRLDGGLGLLMCGTFGSLEVAGDALGHLVRVRIPLDGGEER